MGGENPDTQERFRGIEPVSKSEHDTPMPPQLPRPASWNIGTAVFYIKSQIVALVPLLNRQTNSSMASS